jgi:membrane-associated phospholipid phosphatase
MFQTEIILYLQSFESNALTGVMNFITSLGDDKFFGILMLALTLGISYQKGMLLNQMFFWGLMLNDGLKALFRLPRPRFVNHNIQNLQFEDQPLSSLIGPGAQSFFGKLDPKVVRSFRDSGSHEFGFPSGHVSATTVLWGGMAQIFKKRILSWLTAVLILLMAFSRVYLGRHFLADAFGGVVSGGIILLLAFLFIERWKLYEKLPTVLRLIFMFGIPLVLGLAAPDVFGTGAGYLLGINAVSVLVHSKYKGNPDDKAALWKRFIRALLGIGLFFLTMLAFDGILEMTNLEDVALVENLVVKAITIFVGVYGAVALSFKLGLYHGIKGENLPKGDMR